MKRALSWPVLMVALLIALVSVAGAGAEGGIIHVVRPGETLSSIARLYGVTPGAVAAANGLADPDLILVGQKLKIPRPTPATPGVHVVARGETLTAIARRYGLSVWQLAAHNGIANPDRIYVGQRLLIPWMPDSARAVPHPPGEPPAATEGITSGASQVSVSTATAMPIRPPSTEVPRPEPQPTPSLPPATPTAQPIPCPCEEIVILSPAPGITVTSPITVSGWAAGLERTVIVTVLDGGGGRIGQETAKVGGRPGQPGGFTAVVPFTVPANSQPGRIQVWTESLRDGAVEHLSSVTVAIQGLELDPLLARLDAAFRAGDYAAWADLMADPFKFVVYKSRGDSLTPAQATERLRLDYVGAVPPRLDFSVDARKLLEGRFTLAADIVHVVYSTGWGRDGRDDAFLLIGNVNGRARWSALLYVPRTAVDYR